MGATTRFKWERRRGSNGSDGEVQYPVTASCDHVHVQSRTRLTNLYGDCCIGYTTYNRKGRGLTKHSGGASISRALCGDVV